MEIKGKVHLIGQVESFGANGFTKQLLVVKTEEQYPQTIPIEFVKDKITLLTNISLGQGVTIGVNPRGSEWTDKNQIVKYSLSFNGWSIK